MQINWIKSLVLSLMLVWGASAANAAGLPPKLESAITAFEAHQDYSVRFAFTRITYKDGRKAEIKQFDPTRPRVDMWRISLPSQAQNPNAYKKVKRHYSETEGTSDTALIVPNLRKRLGLGANFLRKDQNVDVYGFKVADTYILEGGGMKQDIHENILGEIAINQYTNVIEWIRYYAPKPFRPVSFVKLRKYQITQYVKPAWEGGPLVRVYETSKVEGSAPLTRIHVDEIMINQNFVPKTPGMEMVSKTPDSAARSGQ